MTETVIQIPIAKIAESRLNPRKTFGDLGELVASIKAQGVLVPVLVRPLTPSAAPLAKILAEYELVYGARRLRAGLEAELKEIPAIVRELDDRQAREAQLIENGQRADVPPLEEADAFRQLLEEHGLEAEEVAAKVGKSVGYVLGRMKLCALCEPVREAVRRGDVSAAVALLIARIPDPKLQEEVLAQVGDESEYGAPMSAQEVADLIEDKYMLRLGDAPFDRTADDLVPGAGACSTCVHRTGNQRELFSDVSCPDLCTNPQCWAEKKKAGWALTKAAAEAKGQKVLSASATKKVLSSYGEGLAYGAPYIDLEAKCEEDPKGRTWKQLLGKDADSEATVICQSPATGNVRRVMATEDAKRLVKKKGLEVKVPTPAKTGSSGGGYDWKAEDEKRKKRLREADAVASSILAAIVEKAEQDDSEEGLLRLLVQLLSNHYDRDPQLATKRLDLPTGDPAAFMKRVAKLSVEQLRGLAVEMAFEVLGIRNPWLWDEHREVLDAACKRYRVDRKKLETEAKKQLAAEEKVAEKAAAGKDASTPGTCKVCGCTETTPCEGGCAWADSTRTVCTACVELEPGEKPVKKARKGGRRA